MIDIKDVTKSDIRFLKAISKIKCTKEGDKGYIPKDITKVLNYKYCIEDIKGYIHKFEYECFRRILSEENKIEIIDFGIKDIIDRYKEYNRGKLLHSFLLPLITSIIASIIISYITTMYNLK